MRTIKKVCCFYTLTIYMKPSAERMTLYGSRSSLVTLASARSVGIGPGRGIDRSRTPSPSSKLCTAIWKPPNNPRVPNLAEGPDPSRSLLYLYPGLGNFTECSPKELRLEFCNIKQTVCTSGCAPRVWGLLLDNPCNRPYQSGKYGRIQFLHGVA
jgi:hypothetical protein